TTSLGRAGDYPWTYYFDRPEMPEIHCASVDACGNVVVSTGDWKNTQWFGTSWWHEYWSEGMFLLHDGDIREIQCPENTNVQDCATDSAGTTWILLYRATGYYEETSSCGKGPVSLYSGKESICTNPRVAMLEDDRLVVDDDLTASIPSNPWVVISDPEGRRVFVISQERGEPDTYKYFVSWWATEEPRFVHVHEVPDTFTHIIWAASWGQGFAPRFGPDDLVYFFAANARGWKADAIMRLDPDTWQWSICSGMDYPLLDSVILDFYVDPMNVKWFGTEDGLVRFDGETWTRYTSQNSALPFDEVQKIAFDSIDRRYYVISRGRMDSMYYTAMSYLDIDGEFSPHSDYFSPMTYKLVTQPRLIHDALDAWWYHPPSGNIVYYYDHERLMAWQTDGWSTSGSLRYMGCLSSGRRFAMSTTCVMIW
ncbi:MAG: hypothetical protein JW941_12195, partial [Candidatus Coatesbacteria bacterium]|nr:hypothetical protein [Candidatus Coatesbacteria bacterium]